MELIDFYEAQQAIPVDGSIPGWLGLAGWVAIMVCVVLLIDAK